MTDTIHEAPERIWVELDGGEIVIHNNAPNLNALIATGYLTKYTRDDLVQAAVAAERKPHKAAAALLSAGRRRLAPVVLNAVQAERDKWEQTPEVLRGNVPAETITLAMFEACLAAIREGGE